ncbi:MAG: helix-turn-helix domain-containing protein [Lachnospiraceae bacterium]|nr:helix-turn-helix domain-containing protein [Lachnospiraceae bacterium]
MNGYITAQEAADKWGITPRQVQILCKANCVVGAIRLGRIWIIPEDAEKATNNRRKEEYCND